LGRVRDTFLFGCYTGLRHSDLYRLSEEHIMDKGEYRVISIVPQKSVSAMRIAKRVQIPLIPEAEELIEKYKNYNSKTMPMLTNQRMNIYIKEIGKRAGLDYDVEVIRFEKSMPKIVLIPKYELLTCHISRHTFATQSLIRGMKVEVLQKILGHSNIKQTLTYAKVIDEFKEKEMLKAWRR
jgi:integrase/recombinase XerD